MEHKQGKTPIKTDNSTANKFANNNIKHRHSKHMDMRYHWIKDCQNQQQFQVYWRPGTENNAGIAHQGPQGSKGRAEMA